MITLKIRKTPIKRPKMRERGKVYAESSGVYFIKEVVFSEKFSLDTLNDLSLEEWESPHTYT